MKKNLLTLTVLFCVLLLAQLACSLPGWSDAQETQALDLSDEQVTATPEAGPAQPTPRPTQSGTGHQPGSQQPPQCQEGFVANANFTNGQIFHPGDNFQVVWTIENTGDCTWEGGYALELLGGDIIAAESSLPLTSTVNPGGTISLSVNMQAPAAAGSYVSAWKMQNPQGHKFGQDSPPDSPLRLAIRVIPQGNQGNNPTPNPTPNPTSPPATPEVDSDVALQGTDQTLLDGQCFDLNTGNEVDCSDSAADIQYQYALFAKIYGQNDTALSGNQDDEPEKAICENASYAPLPHTVLEEKFFCFQIDTITKTTYGWIRVERFDEEGLTFDFATFTANLPEMQPINPNTLFVESQGDQVTMLKNECFDVQNGQLNEQCTGVFAGFQYEETTIHNLTVMQIKPNEVSFAAMSAEPSKSDCETASYNQAAIWPIIETGYYCYTFTPGMNTYFGWVRPTQFDNNGLTFDYLTWQAAP